LREQVDEFVDRHRLAEEKTLDELAAAVAQERQLIPVLDSFGDHLHVEIVRQVDDRLRDGSTATAPRQVFDECARQFHAVELKVEQMGNR